MTANKLPVQIEYYPFTREYHKEILAWSTPERPIVISTPRHPDGIATMSITTLEGQYTATEGKDVIIKGVKGEVYPCKLDIFKQTYSTEPKPTAECKCEDFISEIVTTENCPLHQGNTHKPTAEVSVDYKEQLRDWWYSVQDLLAEKDICLHERKRVELETIVKQALQTHTTALKAIHEEGALTQFRKVVDASDYEWDKGETAWAEHLKAITNIT